MRKLLCLPLVMISLAMATPALAAGVTPGAATPVQREQAQSRFLRGKERFAKGRFAEAHVEFSGSLDLVASPNTRLYLARCEEKMGNLVAAFHSFGRTEVEAKELSKDDSRYEKAGHSAHEERERLGSKLGFVDIAISNAEESTTLKVAGDVVRRGGWSEPVPMVPGKTDIVVETPGQPPITRSVEVLAGEKKSLAIDAAEGRVVKQPASAVVPEKPKTPFPYRTTAYVAGGVAIVGLGMFTIFGLESNSTYSNLESACGNGPCPPGHEDDISLGKTQQTLANVGLVFFVAGAATSITMLVLESKAKQNATTAKVKAGPSFVGLEGTF